MAHQCSVWVCVRDDSLKGQDNSRSQVTLLDTSPAHTLLSICGVLHAHMHSGTCLQDIINSSVTNYSRSHSEVIVDRIEWNIMSATKWKRKEFVKFFTQVWHFSHKSEFISHNLDSRIDINLQFWELCQNCKISSLQMTFFIFLFHGRNTKNKFDYFL